MVGKPTLDVNEHRFVMPSYNIENLAKYKSTKHTIDFDKLIYKDCPENEPERTYFP